MYFSFCNLCFILLLFRIVELWIAIANNTRFRSKISIIMFYTQIQNILKFWAKFVWLHYVGLLRNFFVNSVKIWASTWKKNRESCCRTKNNSCEIVAPKRRGGGGGGGGGGRAGDFCHLQPAWDRYHFIYGLAFIAPERQVYTLFDFFFLSIDDCYILCRNKQVFELCLLKD